MDAGVSLAINKGNQQSNLASRVQSDAKNTIEAEIDAALASMDKNQEEAVNKLI